VYRSTTSGFAPSSTTLIASVNGTSRNDPVSPGTYYYRVIARDGAGNSSQPSAQASATATAPTDTTHPSVTITAPANGSTVSGTVTLSATASDNVAVVGVRFRVDGADVGSEDTTAPYSAGWNSAAVTAGQHQITAVARDAAGNTTTSATVTVTVATQLPSGLVAAYGFNEGFGSTVADASGTGNTGTVGGATWTTGKYGGALSFSGSSNWVTVPDANSLDLNKFTISAWVKPAAAQSGWRTAVLKEIPASGLAYALYVNGVSPSAPAVYLDNGTEVGTGTGPSSLPVGAWSYVTGSYDGSTLRLYVDGVLKASKASTGTTKTSSGPLRIGGNALWGEWFNGALDEIRIYNRALSATEVATDRATPIG
jgi:hypothetical protein